MCVRERACARATVCMYAHTDASYVGGYMLHCFIITDEWQAQIYQWRCALGYLKKRRKNRLEYTILTYMVEVYSA